jgi:hypothetical protein
VLLTSTMAFVALACGPSGPEMARVSGKVTYKGQPVEKGTIAFVSTDPARPNASGVLGAGGAYDLQTHEPGDGAQLGEYVVTISGKDPEAFNTEAPGEPVKKQKSLVPLKYENPDSSGLKKTVESGSNTFDFDLE